MTYDHFNYRFTQRASSLPSNTPDSERHAIERLKLGSTRSKAMLKLMTEERVISEAADRVAYEQNHSAK